jgi:hypothetical protein
VPREVAIVTPVTLTSCVIFSFQAKDPHVDLPQPASTVPEAVSSPAVKAIDKLARVTPAPSSILGVPNVNVDETPVKEKIDSCSATAVPAADVNCNESKVTKLSATTDSVPNANEDETPERVTVIELCWPQNPCPHVPSFQASAMVMTSYIKIILI